MSALLNLGYQRQAVERAIDRVTRNAPDVRFEQALKEILRLLMRG